MRRALLLLVLAGLLGPASSVAAAPPLISVSPDHVDFGTRPVGTTDRRTITITNVTSAPVFIGALTVTAERGGFHFAFGTQNCPQFLDPGASCSYGVDLDVFRRGALLGDSTVTAAQGSANVVVHIPLSARGFYTTPIPHPKTRQVDDDRAQCPHAGYTHIQAAVSAASAGDRIVVCPGTYTEQVRVRDKPQLALESRDPRAATIRFPRPEKLKSQALVHIVGSDEVDVRGFVLSGPFATAGGCGAHSGVRVESS